MITCGIAVIARNSVVTLLRGSVYSTENCAAVMQALYSATNYQCGIRLSYTVLPVSICSVVKKRHLQHALHNVRQSLITSPSVRWNTSIYAERIT